MVAAFELPGISQQLFHSTMALPKRIDYFISVLDRRSRFDNFDKFKSYVVDICNTISFVCFAHCNLCNIGLENINSNLAAEIRTV